MHSTTTLCLPWQTLYTFVFTLLTISGSLHAQTIIEGIVMDNSKDIPISGASISVNGTESGTHSGDDGAFVLEVWQELPTRISITFLGYELKEIDIIAPTNNLLVSLVPGALVGQEIVVTASRKREKVQEAPSAMDVIEEKELQVDIVSNPFLSLRNKMGLDVAQTGVNGGHITLRGRSAVFQTETFVMSDYRNLILPGLGTLAYGQQPVDAIDLEKIEIVKGPGSALYGPGVEAGIVHFISKSPFDLQGTSISIGGGTRNTIQGAIRQAGVSANRKFGYKFTGYYRNTRDWEIDPDDPVEASHLASFQPTVVSSLTGEVITRNIPDYDVLSYGFTGTMAFRPGDNTTITAVGGWSVEKALFRTSQGEGYTAAPRPFGQIRVQSGGWFGQAFWSYHGGSDGKAFLYPTGLTTITESHQMEGQLQYNFNLGGERLNVIAGSDYRFNTIDSKRTVHGRWEDRDDYTIIGGYLQTELKVSKKLDLVGAARVDRFVALEESSFSPRLGLVFKPSPKHTLRATFNRAIGAPTAINLFADLPLADNGAFQLHLLGGADAVSFDRPRTTSFLPGVGEADGIGVNLQDVFTLLTGQLEDLGAIPTDIMEYLISMKDRVTGFSHGVLSQTPLTRDKLQLSNSNMYEIGYKGLIDDKLGIEVDVYYNHRRNVVSAPFQASPLVLQPTLAADLSTAITTGLDEERLAGIGLSPMAIINMYHGLAETISLDTDSRQPKVLGLVRSDQTPGSSAVPTLDLAYYNIREIDYFGLDFSLKYYITGDFSASGSLSWLSQAYFEDVPVGEGAGSPTTDFSLNIPDTRIKLGMELNPEIGVNAFVMVRYQSDWISNSGLPWAGPVEEFVIADLGVGYSFRNGVRVNATVTNLFEEKYRAFFGAPKIGRQLLARTYFHF